jgi:hypothetical protein
MTGSAFLIVLVAVILSSASACASPIFLVPVVVIALGATACPRARPPAAQLRRAARRGPGGVPETSEAAYEPVAEPRRDA